MKRILIFLFAAAPFLFAENSVYYRNVCDSLKWSSDPVMHMVFESVEETDWTGKFSAPSAGSVSKSTYGEEFFSTATLPYWTSPYAVPYALDAPCSDPAKNTYQYQTYSRNRGTWTLNSKDVYSRLVDMSTDTLQGFESAYNWVAFPEESWTSVTRSFSSEELLLSRTFELHASTFHAYAVYFDTTFSISGSDTVRTVKYYSAQALDLDSATAFSTALSTLEASLTSVSTSGNVSARILKITLQNKKDIETSESSSSTAVVSSASGGVSSSADKNSSSSEKETSSASVLNSSSSKEISSSAVEISSSIVPSSSAGGASSAAQTSSASAPGSSASSESSASSKSSTKESSSSASATESVIAQMENQAVQWRLSGRDLHISRLDGSPATLEIFDLRGNCIRRMTLSGSGEKILSLAALPSGNYVVVLSGKTSFVKRIAVR